VKLVDLIGKRVLVWGLGKEGQAALDLLARHTQTRSLIAATDDAPTSPEAAPGVPWTRIGDVDFDQVDVIVKSPGVSPRHPVMLAEVASRGIAVTGGTALWFAETNGDRTIAVTGSKGKSTTSSLIAHFLTGIGQDARLAGNVGRALLDVLVDQRDGVEQNPDWYVLELSSYQTAELQHSPEVGVLTALFPEHLDWHGSVEQYYDDKCNLFAHRAGVGVAANVDNDDVAARVSKLPNVTVYGSAEGANPGLHVLGTRIVNGSGVDLVEIMDLADSMLVGRHNAVNVCGALTALQLVGVDLLAHRVELAAALRTFRPLAHRLEPVGEHRGRLVIDDSLSTAPQAAVAALAAFDDRPVGIIVGGHDRGLDYQPLADALARRTTPTWVCGVPLSGERIVPLIEATMHAYGTDQSLIHVIAFDDFDAAVHYAASVVPEGGVLLLSPAAPSFGRFRNYAERGQHFRSLLGLASS
jgi:UDP-N-acetylmuramoyl-L-alanine---L-glutamate ligase